MTNPVQEVARLRRQIVEIAKERDVETEKVAGELAFVRRELAEYHKTFGKINGHVVRPNQDQQSNRPEPVREQTCFIELGRFGDIINILPICSDIYNNTGLKPVIAVSRQFASLFDGVSYAECIPFDLQTTDVIPAAMEARRRFTSVVVCQVWGRDHEPEKLTPHYNMDSWRLAGYLDRWTDPTLKLEFDRRDYGRERRLVERCCPKTDKPVLLINAQAGHSSPFEGWQEFQVDLVQRWGSSFQIVDIGNLEAERIYDLVGLMDIASCLITIDTATLHLAAACRVPTIALLSHVAGWRQSEPRCNCVLSFGSNNWKKNLDALNEMLGKILNNEKTRSVWHACEEHPTQDPRILRAKSSWTQLYDNGWIKSHYGEYKRDATNIGDKRNLPYLKDVLNHAIELAGVHDYVVLTNDDTILHPDVDSYIRNMLRTSVAVSSRRVDFSGGGWSLSKSREEFEAIDRRHFGRDLFAFRVSWLRTHMDEIPDFILGCTGWDLCLAGIVRKLHGSKWVPQTSTILEPSCELPLGLVIHEDHSPKWIEDEHSSPANVHNLRLLKTWMMKNVSGITMPWFNKV